MDFIVWMSSQDAWYSTSGIYLGRVSGVPDASRGLFLDIFTIRSHLSCIIAITFCFSTEYLLLVLISLLKPQLIYCWPLAIQVNNPFSCPLDINPRIHRPVLNFVVEKML